MACGFAVVHIYANICARICGKQVLRFVDCNECQLINK